MFTGIVEEVGRIVDVSAAGADTSFRIEAPLVSTGLQLGESVSVDGACLTVIARSESQFVVGVAPETLRRTNLGERGPGDEVNLERAVAAGARMGGHYVQGHVDLVGRILDCEPDGPALRMVIEAEQPFMPYIVEKGFIGVDGISLTVTGRGKTWFSVMLIPYTQQVVTLARKAPNATVNLEVDVVAKYVESLLEGRFEQLAGIAQPSN